MMDISLWCMCMMSLTWDIIIHAVLKGSTGKISLHERFSHWSDSSGASIHYWYIVQDISEHSNWKTLGVTILSVSVYHVSVQAWCTVQDVCEHYFRAWLWIKSFSCGWLDVVRFDLWLYIHLFTVKLWHHT